MTAAASARTAAVEDSDALFDTKITPVNDQISSVSDSIAETNGRIDVTDMLLAEVSKAQYDDHAALTGTTNAQQIQLNGLESNKATVIALNSVAATGLMVQDTSILFTTLSLDHQHGACKRLWLAHHCRPLTPVDHRPCGCPLLAKHSCCRGH
jgi:hypothetical protein